MRRWETRFFRTYELADGFRVQIRGSRPVLSPRVDSEVERHWQNALTADSSLFNGAVFSADILGASTIIGHWTEFRRVVAQVSDPCLYAKLALRPVSVSGLLLCSDAASNESAAGAAVILGRRSAHSIFQASIWQLAPAGSLDDSALKQPSEVDWYRQLLRELREEVGVPAEAVQIAGPICMVEYPDIHSLEIGVPLLCRWHSRAVLEAHRSSGNSEYEELRAVGIADLTTATSQLGARLSPPARIFLQRLLDNEDLLRSVSLH